MSLLVCHWQLTDSDNALGFERLQFFGGLLQQVTVNSLVVAAKRRPGVGNSAGCLTHSRHRRRHREIPQLIIRDGHDVVARRVVRVISDVGGGTGTQLSVGQQQLLALARALVGDPIVLLLDEATAAVDGATESAFRQALGSHLHDRQGAVITIAHRLSTAMEADHIIVMESGRIVEAGPPKDLVGREGPFAGLWQLENAGWEWRGLA